MNQFAFKTGSSVAGSRFSSHLKKAPTNFWGSETAQIKIFNQLTEAFSVTLFGNSIGINCKLQPSDLPYLPLTDYHNYEPFLGAIKNGSLNVLWPGKPLFMAITSGTIEGKKYIPVTKDSLANQFLGPSLSIASLIKIYGKKKILDSPPLTFGDAPLPERFGLLKAGPLSAMLAYYMPVWARNFSYPTFKTRCIKTFQERILAIAAEIEKNPPNVIVAMPPWLREFLLHLSKPLLSKLIDKKPVLLLSGMNPLPYIEQFKSILSYQPEYLETYPASEGFFGWQDEPNKDIRLLVHNGIFYELLTDDIKGKCLPLINCVLGDKGELIVTTNAGLFRYKTGDLVEITDINPFRIKILGRSKQTLVGFGEHLTVLILTPQFILLMRNSMLASANMLLLPLLCTRIKKPITYGFWKLITKFPSLYWQINCTPSFVLLTGVTTILL